MNYNKQKLLEDLKGHITQVQENIAVEECEVRVRANKSLQEIGSMQSADQVVYLQLKAYAVERLEQLEYLYKTPYFTKCVILEKDGKSKDYFFAKYQLSEAGIYSWISPIATLRFENPGIIQYSAPDGELRKMILERKEQYMIVDGRVVFFSREDNGVPRELIYQEHFTIRKQGFVLPEIVAQMEKAQDKVIRAHCQGPLVIAGPAGSGKTTLALHRVAYLTQAPDTASLYPAESIIVFVQDNGTKEYFSHLLPGLGIHNVTITTFSEWAIKILGLEGYEYIARYGNTDEERDMYEYKKIIVLRDGIPAFDKNPYVTILRAYKNHFVSKEKRLFQRQKIEKKLDRFDLTILLSALLKKEGTFRFERRYEAVVKGVVRKRIQTTEALYSLMVVDEFQNYLPEQLSVLKSCLSGTTESTIYVGDMAQQVYLGTIRKWEEIGEEISPERNITLDKVYRNTRNILIFIQKLGYPISIPEGIKEGPEVVEIVCLTKQDEIEHVRTAAKNYSTGSVGVLAKDDSYLNEFRKEFDELKNMHFLTMNESQGVEFDLVILVGISAATFKVMEHATVLPEHIQERKRMQRDLLYIALTRAISELHILGKEKLSIMN